MNVSIGHQNHLFLEAKKFVVFTFLSKINSCYAWRNEDVAQLESNHFDSKHTRGVNVDVCTTFHTR